MSYIYIYICTKGYYSVIKKDEILICYNLDEPHMISKITHKQKNKYMIPLRFLDQANAQRQIKS